MSRQAEQQGRCGFKDGGSLSALIAAGEAGRVDRLQ